MVSGEVLAFLITLIFLFIYWSKKTEHYYNMREVDRSWLSDFTGIWKYKNETIVIDHFHRSLIKLSYRYKINNGQTLVRKLPPLRVIPLEETENMKKIKVISSDNKFRFMDTVIKVEDSKLKLNNKEFIKNIESSFA